MTESRIGHLIVISGLPGVGKSAVSREVAARAGAVHLSIDPVHDALLASGLADGWHVGVGAYESVRVMAESNLSLGLPVVVDAVNGSEEARHTWRPASRRTGVQVTWVVLTCSNDIEHRRRLEGRKRGFEHLPEPTWSKVQQQAVEYPAWRDDHLTVDTYGTSPDTIADRIVERVTHASGGVVRRPFCTTCWRLPAD